MNIESYTVGCTVNISHPYKGGNVVAVLYNKDNELMYTNTYNASSRVCVLFEVPITEELEGAYIKIFWWDLEIIKPISKFRLIEL